LGPGGDMVDYFTNAGLHPAIALSTFGLRLRL
jgi:hypothetical protein